MESNKTQQRPVDTPEKSAKQPPIWVRIPGWIAVGCIPALLFLVLLLVESLGLDWPGDTDDKLKVSVLVYGVAVFVLGTPIVLLPWSHYLLMTTHGPFPADKLKLAWRIILIILVSLEMSVANYFVGIVGLFLAAVAYVIRNGLPVVG